MSENVSAALGQNTGFLLSVSSARAVSTANQELTEFGLKARSYTALSLLVHSNGISQREIAHALQMDPSQIVALVDSLENLGLVQRRPDPNDRRLRSVVATAKGKRVQAEAARRVAAAEDTVLSGLSDEERSQLHDLLNRVALGDELSPVAAG